MMKYFIVTKNVAKNGIFSENRDSPFIFIFICKKLLKEIPTLLQFRV